MENAVRRYIRNVLLVHLGLLALVLTILFFASREIYNNAREQALGQAQRRQELLADQTAAGIASSFRSIITVMDLLPRDDVPEDEKLTDSLKLPPKTRQRLLARSNFMGLLLARQLDQRVSHLFFLDKSTLRTRDVILEPDDEASPSTQQIIQAFAPYLKSVEEQSVSPFEVIDGDGLNLVCLPVAKGRLLVVAAVPVERINQEFLVALNSDSNTAAYLFDESLTVMAASRPSLVGIDIAREQDQNVKELMGDFSGMRFNGTLIADDPSRIGGEFFEPAMLTARTIEILPGTRWILTIGSPLSEVDRVVAALFRRIVVWAFLFAGALTAIMLSTSFQMIRGRMRLERLRHEMLTRDLQEARKIQLAWLPQESLCSAQIDIAAVNQPASHISGDFYNWFELPDGRTAVVIGDVTGHGMSAAFLMATTQLLVRNILPATGDPGRCLTEVNRQLCVQVFNGQFVTMQILLFDPEAGRLDIANAGHPAPLIAREAADFEPLPVAPQLILGIEPNVQFPTETFDLPPDGSLLLYTDGVTDLQSPDGQRLYLEGLQRHLAGPNSSAPRLLDSLLRILSTYHGPRALEDDLTLVAIRFQVICAEKELLSAAI